MRDFLQRQIARAGAAAPGLVRPRLPSLFEPVARDVAAAEPLAGAGDDATDGPPLAPPRRTRAPVEEGEIGGEVGPVTVEGPAVRSALPRLGAALVAPAAGSMNETATAPRRSDEDDGRAGDDDAGSPPAAGALRSSARATPAAAPRADVGLAASAEPLESERPARAVATAGFLQPASARPAPARPPAPAGVLQPAAHGRDARGAAPTVARAAMPPRTSAAEALLGRGESRAALAAARPFAPPPAAAVAPTIEVTIGRIEVKASPAAAAAPRRQAPRGPSELETYLRSKGGRRP